MKCFITGLSSSSGQCLAEMLASEIQGADVSGCGMRPPTSQIRHGRYFQCDVTDRRALSEVLDSERPEQIYHLAGSSDAFDAGRMIQVNVAGTANLLQVCHEIGLRETKILLVGSAAGFGEMAEGEMSLSEIRQPRPESFYGMSRETAFEFGRLAAKSWGMSVFFCRPFNLIGPGLGQHYVPSALLMRMIRAKDVGQTKIAVRNLAAIRDFVDIRDAVRAYYGILTAGTMDIPYSIGTGIGITIRELAEEIADVLSLEIKISSEDDPDNAAGRSGIKRSVADIQTLRMRTGWFPRISLRESITDMVARQEENSVEDRNMKDLR